MSAPTDQAKPEAEVAKAADGAPADGAPATATPAAAAPAVDGAPAESKVADGEATQAPVAGEEAKEEEVKPPRPEHLGQPPRTNRVNLPAMIDRGLREFLNRARKILRLEETCVISGVGNAVASVVEVVTILKREKVAEVQKIETSQMSPFNRPRIEVTVTRGEWADLISDFRRRKVIEVFEKRDPNMTGLLSRATVEEMDFGSHMLADDKRRANAEAFLDSLPGEVNLPDFIRYASRLIHPLLMEVYFKKGIRVLGGNVQLREDDEPAVPPAAPPTTQGATKQEATAGATKEAEPEPAAAAAPAASAAEAAAPAAAPSGAAAQDAA